MLVNTECTANILYSKPVVQYHLYSENNLKDMGKEVTKETAWEGEMTEHEYLDSFIDDKLHEVVDDDNVDRDTREIMDDVKDWEGEAYRGLEMLTDDALVDNNVCNMMSSYLSNTNLISKRI